MLAAQPGSRNTALHLEQHTHDLRFCETCLLHRNFPVHPAEKILLPHPSKLGGRGRLIGRTKGGKNTRLHAVTAANGRPIKFFMTAGQDSDATGAAAPLSSLPGAEWLARDRGYGADWYREAVHDKDIRPCIPGRKSRGKPVKYDKRRYKRRNRIEIMFGRLKDWPIVGKTVHWTVF